MNKNESKYFNTAVRMDEALLTLLEKKDFAYITVKELCREAGVNRSTFYLHYENTAELLKETTQYILERHFAYYHTGSAQVAESMGQRLESGDRSALIFISHEYLAPYLAFIQENRRIFQLALRHFDIMHMNEVYGTLFHQVFAPILASFHIAEQARPFMMKFYLSGVFAIVQEWLDGNCAQDSEFIIKVITDCVLGARDIYEQNTKDRPLRPGP